jgi:TolB protein
MKFRSSLFYVLPLMASIGVMLAQQPVPPPGGNQSPTVQQPSDIIAKVTGDSGTAPRMAVPDFLALSSDSETRAIARTIAEVLWNDLNYEREFYMIPRDTYKSIPPAVSIGEPPFDSWRELGADGLVLGSVQKTGNTVIVDMRLFRVGSRQQVYARQYTGSAANPRLYAHTISDEIHETQRNLRGVARTKITFSSDRNRERIAANLVNRDEEVYVKEVYIIDYDGANPRRITVNRQLNVTPAWSPDARSIAYTSWRTGFMDVYISNIYQGTMVTPLKGTPSSQNWLPAFSPDGTRIAFTSNRDGNAELYVANRDGSGARRLTNHAGIDTSPTWSPSGTQIAFVSDRTGTPNVYIVAIDGLGLRRISFDNSDRPTWSPAPYNEIAYTARTGPGYDIKVLDIAKGETRQLTFGEGSNESPAWAPNGRHLAFMSTRAGNSQIFTVDRDGRNMRQLTREGKNEMPNWSQ